MKIMNEFIRGDAYNPEPYEGYYMVTLDGTKEAYKLPNVKKNNSARKIVMAITTGWLQLLFFIYKCFSMGHKYLRSRKKGKKLLISMGVGLLASIIFIIYELDKSELLLDFSIMFILCTICTLVFSIKTFEEKDLYKIDPDTGENEKIPYDFNKDFKEKKYFYDNKWWRSFTQLNENRDYITNPDNYTNICSEKPKRYDYLEYQKSEFQKENRIPTGNLTVDNAIYSIVWNDKN